MKGKVEKAIHIIQSAIEVAQCPYVNITGGKDSLVTLHLIRGVSKGPISVLFIDTSVHFSEIYHFVEKMRKLWRLNLVIEKNQEALSSMKIAEDKAECCYQLKTKVLRNAIKKYGIDYLFTGLRRVEPECGIEDFISPHESYIKINPVLDFSEKDIWDYIREHNLPYCSLYRKGYKSISCNCCTPSLPEQVAKEIGKRENESKELKKKLRSLGYF